MSILRVAAVQFEHASGDTATNLATVERLLAQAVGAGAEVVVFPECCLTGYWFLRNLDRDAIAELAEPVPDGLCSQALRDLAQQHGVAVGAGFVEQDEDGQLYNAWLLALPDGTWQRHRKLHCFVSEHMASGEGYTVFDTPFGWRMGILICYDNNLLENVRMTALAGCDLLLAPHQTGGCYSVNPRLMGLVDRDKWARRETDPQAIEAELTGPKGRGWLMRWLPSRAHDNGLFLAFANGVGYDDDEIRTGNSMVLDPYGNILAETCAAGETVVIADCDQSLLEQATGRRWMKTRRPTLYAPLAADGGELESTRNSIVIEKGLPSDE